MTWVSILKRKPTKEGYYYWLGKSNYGGRTYYDLENGFEFDGERCGVCHPHKCVGGNHQNRTKKKFRNDTFSLSNH